MASSITKETTETSVQLYNRSLFDKQLRDSWKSLYDILLLPLLYTTLLFWACLCLYWGSTVSNDLSRIPVAVVNLDNGDFGRDLVQSVSSFSGHLNNTLDWNFDHSVSSEEQATELLLREKVWAVVQANRSSSNALQQALHSQQSAEYNPLSAVTIYFTSGRNQITTNSKVIPNILAVLNPCLAQINAEFVTKYLIEAAAANLNITAAASHCPACVSSPFAAAQVDLRPFNVTQATGSTMVGMIFLLTFTFTVFQIQRVVALSPLGAQLSLPSAVAFRTLASILSYGWLSLSYALINLAFSVMSNARSTPTPNPDRFATPGTTFMTFWALAWCTMGALGLPMESLFTFIGLKWAGYFLSFWIVVNVSSSFQSFELMPRFYQYGYAFPFFNSIQATRTILFNTKSHLGRNFGVLIAWMILGLLGMAVGTRGMMRRNLKGRGKGKEVGHVVL